MFVVLLAISALCFGTVYVISISSLTTVTVPKFVTFGFQIGLKFENFVKILFVKFVWPLWGTVWARSNGRSGAVPRLINMQQQQINMGQ